MNSFSHLLINLLDISMVLKPSLYLKRLLFVIEWNKKLEAICNIFLMSDKLKFGIMNCLISIMKQNHCLTYFVVEPWRSVEWKCFKSNN